MAYTHSIKKLLNIKDPNIHLAEVPVRKTDLSAFLL